MTAQIKCPGFASTPRIHNGEIVEALEVLHVADDHSHPIDECRGADERIPERCWIGDVQRRCASGDDLIDGEHTLLERCSDSLVEPATQDRPWVRVGAFGEEHAMFELVDRTWPARRSATWPSAVSNSPTRRDADLELSCLGEIERLSHGVDDQAATDRIGHLLDVGTVGGSHGLADR